MTLIKNEFFQLNDTIAWQDLGNGIQRKVLGYNANLMLVKVKFEKNAIGVMHQHEHTQSSFVESGKFELTIGGQTRRLKEGDGYFVPPHVLHGCICLEPGILIDAFSPAREDFI